MNQNDNNNVVVGIQHNTEKKIKLLKDIINASVVAKKIFPDDLSIRSIIKSPKNTELSPIIHYDPTKNVNQEKNNQINSHTTEINNEKSNNIDETSHSEESIHSSESSHSEESIHSSESSHYEESIHSSESSQSEKSTHSSEPSLSEESIHSSESSQSEESIHSSESSQSEESTHSSEPSQSEESKKIEKYNSNKNSIEKFPNIEIPNNIKHNNLLKPVYNNELSTYNKLSLIYGLRKTNKENQEKINSIKTRIQSKVVGTVDSTNYKNYIKNLDNKYRRLLNKFLMDLRFRFKINNEFKLLQTKKKGNNSNLSKKKDMETDIQSLTNIISKTPKLSHDIVVFKHLSLDVGSKLEKGSTLTDKTISVCHYNPLEDFSENTVIMKITIKKNKRCLIVCPDNGYLYKDSEILIKPLSKLNIKGKREIKYNNFKTTVIDAEL
jgi:hypothetical protein